MTPIDTKARILDAAEALFSERGFAGTSTRDITAAAGVNLAAVNYHFGAKAALVREVFRRRFGALNDERLARLAQAVATAGSAPVPVTALVRALVAPALHLGAEQGQACMRLMGCIHSEPAEFVVELVRDHFADVRTRFVEALRRSVPALTAEQAFLRLFFTVGAMAHSMGASHHLALLATEGRRPFVLEEIEDELVRFAAAGILAEVDAATEARR